MDATAALGLLSWGVALYLWRNGARLHQISRTIRGTPYFSVPLASKAVYTLLGVLVGSTVFVGIAVADGADPFDHFQRVFQAPIRITATPDILRAATPTLIPSPTLLSTMTITASAVPTSPPPASAVPVNTPPAETPENGQGWQKTPNGQGQGQFQTPPGQGGVPPGQQKQTDEPKPTKDNGNNQGGNSIKR